MLSLDVYDYKISYVNYGASTPCSTQESGKTVFRLLTDPGNAVM